MTFESEYRDGMCLAIDDLPSVSYAFKKCMKGRCGCGGSRHKKTFITCDDLHSCGPCAGNPACDPYGCAGCSLNGTRIWYCEETSDPCLCVQTIFHEMSHACGANDQNDGSSLDAYRIGDWFRDKFREMFPNSQCIGGIP